MPERGAGVVDMFGERPGRGSLLSVVPGAGGRSAQWMAATARRNRTDETSFVLSLAAGEYQARVYNPWGESPYGSHSAAGTAAFLVASGLQECGWQLQRLPSGSTSTVWTDGASVTVHFPPGPAAREVAPELLAAALPAGHPARNAPAVHSGPGNGFTLVDVGRCPLEVAAPLVDQMAALGLRDLTLYHCDAATGTATARVFAPGYHIDADPACAPVAAALGAHLASRDPQLLGADLDVHQVTDREKEAHLKVRTTAEEGDWSTRVCGRVWMLDGAEDGGG